MNSLFQVSEFINVFSVFGFPIDLGNEGGLMMVGPGAAGPAETPAGFTMLYNPAPILAQTNKQREANMLFTMLCNPPPILAQTNK